MRPPCFSKAILYYDAPLPSSGSARAAFPSIIGTIRALRLPAMNTESLMFFASPLQPILSEFAPVRWRTPLRPGPVHARYRWLLSAGHSQDLPGSWGIHPIPLPRSRTSAGSTVLTVTVSRRSSRLWDNENTSIAVISRLNHAASVSAAYASRACRHALCKARFRWMASPCRVGVEPTGFH